MKEFADELKEIFGNDRVITDGEKVQEYSFDKCPRNLLIQKEENIGMAVVRPRNKTYPSTLPLLVFVAKEYGKKIVVRGGGSGVCGSAVPRDGKNTVIVDMTALDSVEISDSEKCVIAGAGILGSVLEEAVQKRGYTLGHSPASLAISTPGGWAATFSSGQFSARYGNADDLIVAVETVDSRGAIKWIAGSELKNFLGMEGTTGIITKVKMKIFPLARYREFQVYSFAKLLEMIGAMEALFYYRATLEKNEVYLSALRAYDLADQLLVAKPHRSSSHKNNSWKQQIEKWFVGRPKLANSILDLLGPKFLMILVLESDNENSLKHYLATVNELLAGRKAVRKADEIGRIWHENRYALNYGKLVERYQKGFVVDTFDCTTNFANLTNLYETVRNSVRHLAVTAAHFGIDRKRPYIYFTFAAVGDIATYDQIWQTVLDACAKSGAFTTHHHGIGYLKSGKDNQDVTNCYGEKWLEEAAIIKSRLDPGNYFNPGNIFNG